MHNTYIVVLIINKKKTLSSRDEIKKLIKRFWSVLGLYIHTSCHYWVCHVLVKLKPCQNHSKVFVVLWFKKYTNKC